MKPGERVYFIRPVGFTGPIKIGYSRMPPNRLQSLMAWSPLKLEIVTSIPGGRALELNIHQCLYEHRSHSEWFFATAPVVQFVERILAGIPVERALDLQDRKVRTMAKYANPSAERRLYLSFNARLRNALTKIDMEREAIHIWGEEAKQAGRDLDIWGGQSTAPESLLRKLEEILENPASFCIPLPKEDWHPLHFSMMEDLLARKRRREERAERPLHVQSAPLSDLIIRGGAMTPAPDMGGCA